MFLCIFECWEVLGVRFLFRGVGDMWALFILIEGGYMYVDPRPSSAFLGVEGRKWRWNMEESWLEVMGTNAVLVVSGPLWLFS